MPPHVIMGYSWQEIASIVAILTALGSLFIWSINQFIVKPLSDSINRLAGEVKDFKSESRSDHDDFKRHFEEVDSRLENTEIKITAHDEKFNSIFHQIGGRNES